MGGVGGSPCVPRTMPCFFQARLQLRGHRMILSWPERELRGRKQGPRPHLEAFTFNPGGTGSKGSDPHSARGPRVFRLFPVNCPWELGREQTPPQRQPSEEGSPASCASVSCL